MDIKELGQKTKAKYPQYQSLSDEDVGQKVLTKYPQYQSQIDASLKEPQDGFIKTLAKGVARPVATLAVRPIQLVRALGGATEEEQVVQLPFGLGRAETVRGAGDVMKDIGRAAETVSLGVGGAIPKIGKGIFGATALGRAIQTGGRAIATAPGAIPLTKGAFAVKQPISALIKQGAGIGLKGGALFGGGAATEEGGGVVDIITGGLTGGALGLAGGAALPVATRGIGATARGVKSVFGKTVEGTKSILKIPSVEQKFAQKAEQKALLEAGIPDARVAAKALLESGKVVADPISKEAVRQGIPEADVALIKTSSVADKSKMSKMLDIRQSQLTNKRVVDRATDVVGDTFTTRVAGPIEKLNKEAGKRLELVAQRLAGHKVNPSSAITQFSDDMGKAGITVRDNGILNFRNSNFEGLKGVQLLIKNVWIRANRVARTGDALQAHRLKSYIDEIVNYGKQSEGLSGKAQSMLKSFRHNIDTILDTKFPKYNKANTVFAETIQQLDQMGAAIGRRFKLGDTFADAQAGLAMRRILSNTQSRAEILKLLDGMQKVAQKYGIKIDEDIITQANFADVLEKMLGTEAPTSFLGGIQRGAEQHAESIGTDILHGQWAKAGLSATAKGLKRAYEVSRGLNQENKIEALRVLLRVGEKSKSVFGKKVIDRVVK